MSEKQVIIRQADVKDIDRILEINNLAWGADLKNTIDDYVERFKTFPEGEIGAYLDGKVVGIISSLIIQSVTPEDVPSTWADVSDNGKIRNSHNPRGNSLVCFSVGVDPNARGLNIGRLLVNAQADLARKLGLKRVYAYSRPSSYRHFKNKFYADLSDEDFLKQLPIEEYLTLGRDGQPRKEGERLYDVVIGMHDNNGARIVRIIPGGRLEDKDAYSYNVLLEYSL